MTLTRPPTRVECLASLLEADGLAIVLRAGDGSHSTYAAHNLGDVAWGAPPTAVLLARVMTEGVAIRTAEVATALADRRIADNLLLTPIASTVRTAAALATARAGRMFTDEDMAIAGRVAALVALDLHEAQGASRASQTQRLLAHHVRVAREIGTALVSEREVASLAQLIVEGIARAFGADGVSIMLADGSGTLTVRSAVGLSGDATAARRQVGEGISGHVARTLLPLHLAGAVRDERFAGNDPSISDAFVVPLRSEARLIGVLNVRYAQRPGYGEDELLGTLADLADDVASALMVALRVRQAVTDRRDAIVLYELARIALAAADGESALREAAAMIKGALSLDMVAVWEIVSGDLRLRVTAAPLPDLPAKVVVTAGDPIRGMLEDRRPRRISARVEPRRPPWIPAVIREAIAAPISDSTRPKVLVLGRADGTLADVDVGFAGVLGTFLASVLAEVGDGRGSHSAGDEPVPLQRPTLVTVPHTPPTLRPRLSVAASDALEAFRTSGEADIRFWATGAERDVPPAVEAAALSVIGEALRNVTAHARAGHVEVTVRYEDEQVVLLVEDDGVGFQVDGAGGDAARHWSGLSRLRADIEAAGGQLDVRSDPGRGTTVRATFPTGDAESGPYKRPNTADRDTG